ncbi:hypothetical protein POPTR_019G021902v4 [Populus trichocarpa]|uniref:Uncharacterized protein n=1 Tax=Populus trichocarpa TaxID=3694 RepID=A0ACC0RKQ3_POPTR|nr:hypothetical protein POPTR_019G021902v4 [Populus trichocarpa]
MSHSRCGIKNSLWIHVLAHQTLRLHSCVRHVTNALTFPM